MRCAAGMRLCLSLVVAAYPCSPQSASAQEFGGTPVHSGQVTLTSAPSDVPTRPSTTTGSATSVRPALGGRSTPDSTCTDCYWTAFYDEGWYHAFVQLFSGGCGVFPGTAECSKCENYGVSLAICMGDEDCDSSCVHGHNTQSPTEHMAWVLDSACNMNKCTGEDEFVAEAFALLQRSDVQAIRHLIAVSDGNVFVIPDGSALQVIGCHGRVVMSMHLEAELAASLLQLGRGPSDQLARLALGGMIVLGAVRLRSQRKRSAIQ